MSSTVWGGFFWERRTAIRFWVGDRMGRLIQGFSYLGTYLGTRTATTLIIATTALFKTNSFIRQIIKRTIIILNLSMKSIFQM
jgi:hypothetical protein